MLNMLEPPRFTFEQSFFLQRHIRGLLLKFSILKVTTIFFQIEPVIFSQVFLKIGDSSL